jgi:hypothetical protein
MTFVIPGPAVNTTAPAPRPVVAHMEIRRPISSGHGFDYVTTKADLVASSQHADAPTFEGAITLATSISKNLGSVKLGATSQPVGIFQAKEGAFNVSILHAAADNAPVPFLGRAGFDATGATQTFTNPSHGLLAVVGGTEVIDLRHA